MYVCLTCVIAGGGGGRALSWYGVCFVTCCCSRDRRPVIVPMEVVAGDCVCSGSLLILVWSCMLYRRADFAALPAFACAPGRIRYRAAAHARACRTFAAGTCCATRCAHAAAHAARTLPAARAPRTRCSTFLVRWFGFCSFQVWLFCLDQVGDCSIFHVTYCHVYILIVLCSVHSVLRDIQCVLYRMPLLR
jgi:hypothetical protein